MKRSDIRNAYDLTNPTRDQKDKMLEVILTSAPKKKRSNGVYQAKAAETRRWSWVPAACALVLVIFAGTAFLFRPSDENPMLPAAQKDTSRSSCDLMEFEQFRAGQEWNDYLEQNAGAQEADETDIFYPYSAWGCVDQDMVSKLDEICDEYSLTFRDQEERMTDSLSYLLEEVGIETILDANASHETGSCAYWDDGQFYVEGTVSLDQEKSDWQYPVEYIFHRSYPKVFLYQYLEAASADISDCWKYTNADGVEVVLALGDDLAFLFINGEENTIYVEVKNARVGDIQYGEMKMDADAMEAFAETFDFSLMARSAAAAGEMAGDYDTLLEKYKTALTENWDASACQQADISPLILAESGQVGWCTVDLDQNGTEELVITNGEMVFDLYTIMSDGGPGHLLLSTEESTYALCENGVIQKHTVSGKDSCWLFYNLQDGFLLIPEKAVVWVYEEAQYYAGPTEVDVQAISKDEAGEILVREYANAQVAYSRFLPSEASADEGYLDPLYADVLSRYVRAVEEEWSMEKCGQEQISYLTMYLEGIDEIGYTLMDLDGDGSDELLVSDGNTIYSLYCIQDQEAVWCCYSTERMVYTLTLCDGYNIAFRGANSASSTRYEFFYFEDHGLKPKDIIIYDAGVDPEDPWFYKREAKEIEQPITEAEAQDIINSYSTVTIEIQDITRAVG